MGKKPKQTYRYFKYKVKREGHLIYNLNAPVFKKYQNDVENNGSEYFVIIENTDEIDNILQSQQEKIELTELSKEEFYKSIRKFYDRDYLEWTGIKSTRDRLLRSLVLTHKDISLDANEESMNRINRILSLANFKLNKALSTGSSAKDAYKEIFIDTLIVWKDSKNEFVKVNAEFLAEFLELALDSMNKLWGEYVLPEV